MTTTPRNQSPADAPAPAEQAKPKTSETPFVGPELRPGQTAQKVTLAHHLRIDGQDFQPGSEIKVSPDYARQLRGSGYAARERR
jgi:hypothetical protein